MRIGIPTEVKNNEFRVAITPAGAMELTRHGHEVVVQSGAGLGSSISDDEYVAAGARMLPDADAVWEYAEMILKVKEPIAEEYPLTYYGWRVDEREADRTEQRNPCRCMLGFGCKRGRDLCPSDHRATAILWRVQQDDGSVSCGDKHRIHADIR